MDEERIHEGEVEAETGTRLRHFNLVRRRVQQLRRHGRMGGEGPSEAVEGQQGPQGAGGRLERGCCA